MDDTITEQLEADARSIPRQWPSGSSWPFFPVLILSMAICGMDYLFGQFGSSVLSIFPHSSLSTCSLAEHRKLESPWLRVNTTQQQQKQNCVIINLILNPKHSPVPATRTKTNFLPGETRTLPQRNKQKNSSLDVILNSEHLETFRSHVISNESKQINISLQQKGLFLRMGSWFQKWRFWH